MRMTSRRMTTSTTRTPSPEIAGAGAARAPDAPSAGPREWPAAGRLGGHVTGHQPACGAGEAAVGEQRHRLPEALPDDRRGAAEHLAHAGASARAPVTDDHHV